MRIAALWATGVMLWPAVPVTAQTQTIEITEWLVPWEQSRPRDPFVRDPNGNLVWFVGQRSHYAAFLDIETGEFTRFDLEDGTGPHNLIVDPEGYVWYSGNRASHIGKLDPRSGEIAKFRTSSRDPHTLVFDGHGDIWFTAQGANHVGKLTVATEEIVEIPVPTEGSRPYGIKIDSDNRPWIALFGTNKLATVDPSTMQLEEIELPDPETRPRRLEITSDDMVWWVDYTRGYLGRLDPATREITEWAMPGGPGSLPYGMAVDDEDRVWFVESGLRPNRFVGFDPETETFFSITEIESGGGTVRHMMFHEPTRSIWFGTDTNYIGRAQVP